MANLTTKQVAKVVGKDVAWVNRAVSAGTLNAIGKEGLSNLFDAEEVVVSLKDARGVNPVTLAKKVGKIIGSVKVAPRKPVEDVSVSKVTDTEAFLVVQLMDLWSGIEGELSCVSLGSSVAEPLSAKIRDVILNEVLKTLGRR